MLAGLEISKLEGIIPAIETAHAFATFKYLDFKKDDIIVVNFSGRGDKDTPIIAKHLGNNLWKFLRSLKKEKNKKDHY